MDAISDVLSGGGPNSSEGGCGEAGTGSEQGGHRSQTRPLEAPSRVYISVHSLPCPPLCPPRLPTSFLSPSHPPDVSMPTRTRISKTDGLKTRRAPYSNPSTLSSPANGPVLITPQKTTGKGRGQAGSGQVSKAVALSMVDYTLVLSLVFGGCCSSVHVVSIAAYAMRVEFSMYRNVWSYEQLLKMDAHVGEGALLHVLCFSTRLTCLRDYAHLLSNAVHYHTILAVVPDVPQGQLDTSFEASTCTSPELGLASPCPHLRLPHE